MATTPNPEKIMAGLQLVLAEARVSALAAELARDQFPRLWQHRQRGEAELVIRPALVKLYQRGVLSLS